MRKIVTVLSMLHCLAGQDEMTQQGTNLMRKHREGNVITISQTHGTDPAKAALHEALVKLNKAGWKGFAEFSHGGICTALYNYTKQGHLSLECCERFKIYTQKQFFLGSNPNLSTACSPSPLVEGPGWWAQRPAQQIGSSSSPWAPPRPRSKRRDPWLWILGVWLPAERRGRYRGSL